MRDIKGLIGGGSSNIGGGSSSIEGQGAGIKKKGPGAYFGGEDFIERDV